MLLTPARARRFAPVLLALALLRATPAGASASARACIDAHAAGQVERDAGRMLSAKAQFASCTAEACPAMIRRECVALGESVLAMTPSVVLVAEDGEGRAVEGARATIDGKLAIPRLDGRPMDLDPGPHRFELTLLDGRNQTLTATLSSGEKYRRIVAKFSPPPEAPPEIASGPGRNPLAYVFAGVGVAALGAWGYYALDGRNKQNELEQCAPHCQHSDVDAMRKSYAIADVLLGVSLVSLGTGTFLFFRRTDEQTTRGSTSTLWLEANGHF
jgi:hypothetical protein